MRHKAAYPGILVLVLSRINDPSKCTPAPSNNAVQTKYGEGGRWPVLQEGRTQLVTLLCGPIPQS